MDIPHWQFDTIYGREDDVSNPLIEMFEGDYNYYLAREILQNALDAHDPSSQEPVTVTFSIEEFSHSMFPDYQTFLDVFKSAKKFWPSENVKTHLFLDNAIKCLNKGRIPVLKVSDFNTTGLNGSDNDRNGRWYKLVKSVGSTSKHEGEGGSFGLGKGAPFAASWLRTLFYSSKNEIGQNVFQGVAELVSFQDSNGNIKRGSGSYALSKQGSIRNRRLIDEHMVRKDQGLDIYIMGYKVKENWQEKLFESVLRNFWPAINENLLIVDIDGEVLTHNNLEDKLTQFYIGKPFKDNSKPEGNPLQFYQAFKNGQMYPNDLENLGKVKFYFTRTEEPLNRVAMIRKSKMVIFSRDFRWHAPYAGVFVCDNDKGNVELRKMESPQHDVWDKNRYVENGEKIDWELRDFIRGVLRSLATIQKGGIIEIPELQKYLPFADNGSIKGAGGGNADYTENEGTEETGSEIGVNEELEESVIVSPYKVSVINEPTKGHGNGGEIKRKGERKIKKGEKAPGGGEGKADSTLIQTIKSRIFLKNKIDNIFEYCVIIKGEEDLKCKLKFFAIGEEGTEKVKIIEVRDDSGNKFSATGQRINGIHLKKDDELRLYVKIDSLFKISLKMNVYAL